MVGSLFISLFIMSRGAIVSLFAMATAYLIGLFYAKRNINILPMLVIILLILIVMQPFISTLIERFQRSKYDLATLYRLAMWWDALKFMQRNPIFGAGPGQYHYQQFEAMKHDDPHNMFLRYGVEFGSVSVLPLLVITLLPCFFFLRYMKTNRTGAMNVYLCFAPPLIGTFVHSLIDYIINSMSFGPFYWLTWSISVYLMKNRIDLETIKGNL